MNLRMCRRRRLLHVNSIQATSALRRAACVLASAALLFHGAASPIFAQDASSLHPTETDVEAAYLYNFGRFVTWPSNPQPQPQAGAQNPVLNICVLGTDPFGPTLDQIVANVEIKKRPLAVLRLSTISSASACSILFVSHSEASHLEKDLSSLAQLPVLTVSDIPGFLDQGGTIQFVLEDHRVRFEVNLVAAHKCGLTLSSQLLKVAIKVVGNPPEEEPR